MERETVVPRPVGRLQAGDPVADAPRGGEVPIVARLAIQACEAEQDLAAVEDRRGGLIRRAEEVARSKRAVLQLNGQQSRRKSAIRLTQVGSLINV